MGKKNSTALVKAGQRFLVLQREPEELREVIAANLGDSGDVSAFDLDRIKMPTGGNLQWLMPDGSSCKAFEGIVAAWHNVRAYWPEAFSGNTPPTCASEDARVGVGDPGGQCKDCPYSKFGSSLKDGGGQACKEMRRLFVLREGMLLPQLLTLPPTSLRASRQYFVHLISHQLPYWAVVTRFGLTQASSSGGIDYAVAHFEQAGALTPEEAERVKRYSTTIDRLLHAPIVREDYQESREDASIGG